MPWVKVTYVCVADRYPFLLSLIGELKARCSVSLVDEIDQLLSFFTDAKVKCDRA